MKVKMKTIDVLLHAFGARDRNCPSEDSVLAYSENTLPSSSRLRIERHFAGCDDCRELLVLLACETGETAVPLSHEDVTEQANRVLGYIRNDEAARTKPVKKAHSAGGFHVSYPKLATTGLAICALVVGALFVIPFGQSPADAAMDALRAGLRDERRTEARISGGFSQSRYRATRGDDANRDDLNFDRALDHLGSVDEANAPLKEGLTMARIYVARGAGQDVEHALSILNRFAERGFDTAEVLNDTGVAYMRLNKYDNAIDCFTRALAKTPRYDEALFNKALAEQRGRRADDARRDWQRFIDQSSDEKWKAEAAGHLRDLNSAR